MTALVWKKKRAWLIAGENAAEVAACVFPVKVSGYDIEFVTKLGHDV